MSNRTGLEPAREPENGNHRPHVPPMKSLNMRALLSEKETLDEEHKMFLCFDAWTDPRLREALEREASSLSDEARVLFYDKRPTIDVNMLRCAFEIFVRLPLDRARSIANGEEYDVEAKVEGRAKLQLDALRIDFPTLVKSLADYLLQIFKRYGKSTDPKPTDVDVMFAKFASGALRISSSSQEYMNAEPDSAYFFAFAEFCIQAARYGASPNRDYWLKLGGLFAALQDVYCLRYHHKGAERRFNEYKDEYRDLSRTINTKLLLAHVESVRKRDGSLDNLVERVTWNALWYFADDVLPLNEEEQGKRERAAQKVAEQMRKREEKALKTHHYKLTP